MRRERKAAKAQQQHQELVEAAAYNGRTHRLEPVESFSSAENVSQFCHKRQLILSTIADLKQSLEDQSVELCGMNDND